MPVCAPRVGAATPCPSASVSGPMGRAFDARSSLLKIVFLISCCRLLLDLDAATKLNFAFYLTILVTALLGLFVSQPRRNRQRAGLRPSLPVFLLPNAAAVAGFSLHIPRSKDRFGADASPGVLRSRAR